MKVATRGGQDEKDRWGKAEQRECGTKHRSQSQKHQDPAASVGKLFCVQTPSPLWMINEGPLNTAQRLCTFYQATGSALLALGLPAHNTRAAAVILYEISLGGNASLYMAVHPDCVKWHTEEVNHQGCSHCAPLHIETTAFIF